MRLDDIRHDTLLSKVSKERGSGEVLELFRDAILETVGKYRTAGWNVSLCDLIMITDANKPVYLDANKPVYLTLTANKPEQMSEENKNANRKHTNS